MLDTEEKRILDKISDLLGNEIILSRPDGTVIYPENEENIKLTDVKIPVGNFFYDGEVGYSKGNLHYEDKVIFSYKASEKEAKKVLGLIKLSFDDGNERIEHEKENFYRGLLLGNRDSLEKIDTWITPNSDRNSGSEAGYTVIYIRNYNENALISDTVFQVVKNIFPEDSGFETVSMEKNSLVIIAFLSEENTFEDVKELAGAVRETVLSETMTSVCVSIGIKVGTLEKLCQSYDEAVKNCKIGLAFGITEGCIDGQKLGLASVIYSVPENVGQSYLSHIFEKLESEEKNGTELIETVNCFLMNNQNISETSRILYVHRNTLMYRIEKFNKITGLDCTKFDDGVKIRIAIMLQKYLKNKK